MPILFFTSTLLAGVSKSITFKSLHDYNQSRLLRDMSRYVDFVDVDGAKNCLQEYCQGQYLPLPVYNLLEKAGPDHSPMFQVKFHVRYRRLI